MEKLLKKPKEKLAEDIVIFDHNATSLTDLVQVAKRNDNSVIFRLLSITPSYLIENHRTVICKDEVISLIKGLCDLLNYYPIKPKLKLRKKPIKKKVKKIK